MLPKRICANPNETSDEEELIAEYLWIFHDIP